MAKTRKSKKLARRNHAGLTVVKKAWGWDKKPITKNEWAAFRKDQAEIRTRYKKQKARKAKVRLRRGLIGTSILAGSALVGIAIRKHRKQQARKANLRILDEKILAMHGSVHTRAGFNKFVARNREYGLARYGNNFN